MSVILSRVGDGWANCNAATDVDLPPEPGVRSRSRGAFARNHRQHAAPFDCPFAPLGAPRPDAGLGGGRGARTVESVQRPAALREHAAGHRGRSYRRRELGERRYRGGGGVARCSRVGRRRRSRSGDRLLRDRRHDRELAGTIGPAERTARHPTDRGASARQKARLERAAVERQRHDRTARSRPRARRSAPSTPAGAPGGGPQQGPFGLATCHRADRDCGGARAGGSAGIDHRAGRLDAPPARRARRRDERAGCGGARPAG